MSGGVTGISGEGRVPCERMVVGAMPGSEDVEQGRPFAGPALGAWLKGQGLSRNDVYVTYACKDLSGDYSRWATILDMEYRAVRPELIALVMGSAVWISGERFETMLAKGEVRP